MATKSMQIILLFMCLSYIETLPEQGIWNEIDYPKDKGYLFFVKSLYKNSIISVTIQCTDCDNDTVTVDCVLRYTPCTQEYQVIDGNKKEKNIIEEYLNLPSILLFPDYAYKTVEFMKFSESVVGHSGYIQLEPRLDLKPQIVNATNYQKESIDAEGENTSSDEASGTKRESGSKPHSAHASVRRKRAEATKKPAAIPDKTAATANPTVSKDKSSISTAKPVTEVSGNTKQATKGLVQNVAQLAKVNSTAPTPNQSGQLVKTWKSGYYLFILKIDRKLAEKSTFKVTVSMKGSVGYISAVEWPLLIFYGVMGLVYIFYGAMWLVMLACNWRDLLRVQYWIGGVILLGMLEKAVFYGDYQNIASTGKSWTEGAVIFAEIVSCLKRALARMLVIVVSFGFGIVKPRLGSTLHKVLFVGGLYFLLATIEGCMRGLKPKGDQSTDMMLAAIPLAIVDASICWWIFSSLVQTVRQLRLRRNVVKLALYRHFTNTLVFAVIASIIFMIWSIIQIKTKHCIKDWQELWIDEAFWHLLFSVILFVIMILWRPSTNTQRYAFSPLLDHGDDDEEEEAVMNDAFDGMKMRPKQANGSPKQKQNTIEDELKWVEENIPSAISDTAQSILESDEEIMTAKYEISKMQ